MSGKIEATESVARKRVSTALLHNGSRSERLNHAPHHGLEDGEIRVVVDAVAQREVQRIVFAAACANVLHKTKTRKRIVTEAEDEKPKSNFVKTSPSFPRNLN